MQKRLIGGVVFISLLLLVGSAWAQPMQRQPSQGSEMMGCGPMGFQGPMGPGAMGPGMGMMGGMGGMMGPMGPGMGMMGPMMGSPEVMGTMMSLHGEMMSLMGSMMQKYGGQAAPEAWQEMRKETIEGMGEIFARQGAALKERAKALAK